jgi:hypothetical protein
MQQERPGMHLPRFVYLIGGSPRARAWLLNHPKFGPHILNWENQRAIAPRAKRLAVATMAAVFALSAVFGLAWWVLAIQAACMGPAALFILTRAEPRAPAGPENS